MDADQITKVKLTYRSYLLRLWYANNAGEPVYRVVLKETGPHPQLQFDSLAALLTYLTDQM